MTATSMVTKTTMTTMTTREIRYDTHKGNESDNDNDNDNDNDSKINDNENDNDDDDDDRNKLGHRSSETRKKKCLPGLRVRFGTEGRKKKKEHWLFSSDQNLKERYIYAGHYMRYIS